MEIKQLKKQYIYIILEHTINIFENSNSEHKQDNSANARIFHAIELSYWGKFQFEKQYNFANKKFLMEQRIKLEFNLKNSVTLQIQRFFTSSTTKIIIKKYMTTVLKVGCPVLISILVSES